MYITAMLLIKTTHPTRHSLSCTRNIITVQIGVLRWWNIINMSRDWLLAVFDYGSSADSNLVEQFKLQVAVA